MNAKYKIETFSFRKLRECIRIPTFQRNVVWNDDKRKEYMDTVLKGFPFGSLLLYKETPETYLLVDGLQRYTTLKDFLKYPQNYINIEKNCKSEINDIIELLKESGVQTNYSVIRTDTINSIKQNFSLTKELGEMVDAIANDVSVLQQNTKCLTQLIAMLQKLQLQYNILDIEIPLIIYQGDYDDLPSIFEKVNANGTQLSRYDIYAAAWSRVEFDYNDISILELVDSKYTDMIERTGVEISNYSPGQVMKEQRINLFEFCFAFGKQLKKECPHIFLTKRTESSDVDSVGFLLLSAILNNSIKSLDGIKRYFENVESDFTNGLINLKTKILECAKKVEDILGKYIMTIDGKNLAKAIDSQIITIVASLFKIKYSLKPNSFEVTPNTNCKKIVSTFELCMPKRYLYDIIRGYWSGSGDTKATDELSKPLENNIYLLPIQKDSWETTLMDWMTDQIQKPAKMITPEIKLFLNYIIRKNISETRYAGKKFDFALIITKKRFADCFSNRPGMATVGNVCILPEYENRSAQTYTLYEDEELRKTITNSNTNTLNDFLYPERSELSFTASTQTMTYDRYLFFVNNRHKYLINIFFKLYGIN
ncbi:MAG: DUF262 domain-containing protein [Ruminococcaceae bacterium]|nr:DUF262 domain-containing protein [Oscillospiraceae bacterium]